MIFTKGGAVMIIDKMDYIFAIAKEQNLTRAAKRLFVAQSTLTMYLNRVEAELGVKPLDRSKPPILPTPAGAPCLEELQKIRHRPDAQRRVDAAAAAAFPRDLSRCADQSH